MKKRFSLGQLLLFMLLGASVAVVATYYVTQSGFASRLTSLTDAQKTFDVLTEVKRCVEKNFVGDYDKNMLSAGAVEGFIDALGDEWSYYLSAEEYAKRSTTVSGGLTGIGMRTSRNAETGEMIIEEVYANSPADKAGLTAGSIITAVDGGSVADIGYESANARIQGDPGSQVIIAVNNGETVEQYTLTRSYQTAENVSAEMLTDEIGYIRIKEFAKDTDTSFADAVDRLGRDGAKSFIFDVRNNGGGEQNVLLSVLDRILPECVSLIVEDKSGKRTEYNSDAVSLNAPIVVLTNRSTYGGAEYFAAVLQEYGRANIIGEQTTGKGYGQSTVQLSDGSALVLSTIRYYTPQYRCLVKTGCIPDVPVALTDSSVLNESTPNMTRDEQLRQAYELLEKN